MDDHRRPAAETHGTTLEDAKAMIANPDIGQ